MGLQKKESKGSATGSWAFSGSRFCREASEGWNFRPTWQANQRETRMEGYIHIRTWSGRGTWANASSRFMIQHSTCSIIMSDCKFFQKGSHCCFFLEARRTIALAYKSDSQLLSSPSPTTPCRYQVDNPSICVDLLLHSPSFSYLSVS